MHRISRKIIVVPVALLALGAAVWFGWNWWTVSRYLQSTDNAYVRGDVTPISPKIAGYVNELLVEDNQFVEAGAVLLRIEDREFRLAVADAEARIAETEAAIANTEARIARQGSVIEQTAAGIVAAQAELDRAASDLVRARELQERSAGTQQRYDLAEADHSKAAAALRRSLAEHDEARQEIAVLESERGRLLAILAQGQVALDLAGTRLADTVVTAPVSGVVGNRVVRLGQYIRPGALLMAIVPLEQVWVEANFKETQLTRMSVGQPVEITVDTYPDLTLSGTVESFSPASGAVFSLLPPENATGNFTKLVQRIPVRIVLDNRFLPVNSLRPGMSVEVTVDTGTESPAGALAQERE